MCNNAFLQNDMLNLLKHSEQIQQICHDFYLYRLKLALLDIRKKEKSAHVFYKVNECVLCNLMADCDMKQLTLQTIMTLLHNV